MPSEVHFEINTPKVVDEVFEDEVIIINLESGNYYSLPGAGVLIWKLLVEGATAVEITNELNCRYYGNGSSMSESLGELILELKQEDIIVERQQRAGTRLMNRPHEILETERLRFEAPHLQKYSDLQDLLLLDPIHDVNDMGWPSRMTG